MVPESFISAVLSWWGHWMAGRLRSVGTFWERNWIQSLERESGCFYMYFAHTFCNFSTFGSIFLMAAGMVFVTLLYSFSLHCRWKSHHASSKLSFWLSFFNSLQIDLPRGRLICTNLPCLLHIDLAACLSGCWLQLQWQLLTSLKLSSDAWPFDELSQSSDLEMSSFAAGNRALWQFAIVFGVSVVRGTPFLPLSPAKHAPNLYMHPQMGPDTYNHDGTAWQHKCIPLGKCLPGNKVAGQ